MIDLRQKVADLYKSLQALQGTSNTLLMRVRALCQQVGVLENNTLVLEERINNLQVRQDRTERELREAKQEIAGLRQETAHFTRQGMH